MILFARANLPVRGISGFSAEADGLGYKYNGNVKSGPQTINGVAYNLYVIEGAIQAIFNLAMLGSSKPRWINS